MSSRHTKVAIIQALAANKSALSNSSVVVCVTYSTVSQKIGPVCRMNYHFLFFVQGDKRDSDYKKETNLENNCTKIQVPPGDAKQKYF